MRVVLVLLILANLGYLAWRQGWVFEAPAPTAAIAESAFQPAVRSLTLLSELPAGRRDVMSALYQARNVRSEVQDQLQQLQQELGAVESEIGENQEELAQDQARSAQVQQELLQTLDVAVAAVAVEEVPPAPVVPWCAVAEGFPDLPAANAFANALGELGITAEIRTREEPISSTWWVHMPAFGSEAAAMDRLEELQAKNIDSYYMRSGEMAGGISLGVYSREESALIAQQQLAGQGYDTSIREVFRMEDRSSVVLIMPDGVLREDPEWAAFLASANDVQVTENACEAVASENEFP